MATRRRFSPPTEPMPRSWAIARRVALPPAANDNRLPVHLQLIRLAIVAVLVGGVTWLIAAGL
ncbi:MAG: hypothetical protein JNL66_06210 [Alphaproteobacteria bacterium]|nr:hypothetical protein [Alphaproteobacteria bacterium]